MIRSFIERIARNRVIKRRLPKRFGRTPLFVSPDAQLKYLLLGEKAFDTSLLRIVDDYIRPGMTVWDIGANVGVFSFASASIVGGGSVLAVEADCWLAALLGRSRNLRDNRSLNIAVLAAAVSDKSGIATFMIAERGRASNALESAGGRSQMGGVREKTLVPTTTLDLLLTISAPPSFIKIDVEGAEERVLLGAPHLLKVVRPTIYIEVDAQKNEEVTRILSDARYDLFNAEKPVDSRKCELSCSENTLAIPRS